MSTEDVAILAAMVLPERDTRWMSDALCANEPPDFWFPPLPKNREKGELEQYAEAVQVAQGICADCPVRDECFADAYNRGERHGIWGGVDFYVSERNQKRERAA